MEERKVTVVEFDEAVKGAMEKLFRDEKLEGMAKFALPLMGMQVASRMRKILFNGDGEKSITDEEMKKAQETAFEEIIEDKETDGMLKFIIPLAGVVFVREIANILFGESEEK